MLFVTTYWANFSFGKCVNKVCAIDKTSAKYTYRKHLAMVVGDEFGVLREEQGTVCLRSVEHRIFFSITFNIPKNWNRLIFFREWNYSIRKRWKKKPKRGPCPQTIIPLHTYSHKVCCLTFSDRLNFDWFVQYVWNPSLMVQTEIQL